MSRLTWHCIILAKNWEHGKTYKSYDLYRTWNPVKKIYYLKWKLFSNCGITFKSSSLSKLLRKAANTWFDLRVGSLKEAPSFLSWTFKNSFQSPFVPFILCFWANFTISTRTYSHIHTIINIPPKQFIDSYQCLLCVCSTSKYMNMVPNTCFSRKQNGNWYPK